MLFDTITYVDGADHLYDLAGSTLSTPSDSDIIMRFKAIRAFRLPQNLAGSKFHAGTGPNGGNLVLKLFVNSVEEGSITKSDTSGAEWDSDDNAPTFGGNISSAAKEIAAGDIIEVEYDTGNSADELYITLKTLAT
jgi:hypothetical protein